MLGLFNEYKRFLRAACLYDNTFGIALDSAPRAAMPPRTQVTGFLFDPRVYFLSRYVIYLLPRMHCIPFARTYDHLPIRKVRSQTGNSALR